MMFRFAYPVALIVPLILVVAWIVWMFVRKEQSIRYSVTSSLIRFAGSADKFKGRLPLMLRAVCLVLLVLACARPQLYNVEREILSPGVDIMLTLDTSGSMQALDFTLDGDPVTRLTAVKKVVNDFISKREHDRIGLIVFGQEAFTQAPLTMDKGLLLSLVEGMQIGMAGDSTAIGSAIAVSAKRLKDLNAASKILILLTDGRNNAGELLPVQAAAAAAAVGVKIYTIGVGSKGEAPFKVNTIFGERTVYQRVDLDEETLRNVALTGGGKFYLASDSEQLAGIYDLIDKEEKSEVKLKEFFHYRELYRWFLIPALIFLFLELILRLTILRVLP
ncbi:MAG: VWA domain-containing protein [Deltaproteobacteria bacterium]|nr:VWA domain-containing protein [Deltaproteobacteria bacterium]